MNRTTALWATLAGSLVLGLAACDNKGPIEQAAEEIDEAVDTVKNGGESAASKADDAVDEVREGVEDAVEEVKGN
jgi:ElaB/YqjD/DUF883 family membrane-anchored ribosome-binding protein